MRVFKYELLKVFTKKLFWGFLIVMLALNIVTLWWLNHPQGLPHSETKTVYDEIRDMTDKEKNQYVLEQIDLMDAFSVKENYTFAMEYQVESDEEFLAMAREEYETAKELFGDKLERNVSGAQAAAQKEVYEHLLKSINTSEYTEYLDYIDAQAKISLGSSIFRDSLDAFSRNNIEKTRDDFENMRDIKTNVDVNTGLDLLFDSPSTDILLILMIIVVCLALITDEKDKRLFLLVKSMPGGQSRTILAKLGTMAVCVVCMSGLVFISNLIYAHIVYGLGDLSRSIQSVPVMLGAILRLNVGQFIWLFFVVKTVGLFVVAMIVMLFALHAKHSILMLVFTVLTGGVNVLLSLIHPESKANWLRYLNPVSFMRPFEMLSYYKNLNFFGTPVNLISVFITFAVVIFTGLFIAVFLSFTKKYALASSQNLFKFKKLPTLAIGGGYRWYEFRKIAFSNKAVLILTVFIIIQGYTIKNFSPPYLGYDHYYFKYTMQSLEGPLTDDKQEFILREKARFDKAEAELAELEAKVASEEISFGEYEAQSRKFQNILEEKGAFEQIYTRYEYVKETPKAQFLYDTGYARFFGLGDVDEGLQSGLKLITVLILCLCGVFAIEYKTGMYKVLNATKRGHTDTIWLKIWWSAFFTSLIFVCTYLPDLLYLFKYFGTSGISLPLSSVAPTGVGTLPSVFGGIPVVVYFILVALMRYITCIGIMIVVLALSLAIKGAIYSAICAIILMVMPLFLHVFNITFMDSFSLYNLILINPIFTTMTLLHSALLYGVYGALTIVCLLFIFNRFGENNPLDFNRKKVVLAEQ